MGTGNLLHVQQSMAANKARSSPWLALVEGKEGDRREGFCGSPVGHMEGIRYFPYPPAIVGEEVGTQGPETPVRYIVPGPPARYSRG